MGLFNFHSRYDDDLAVAPGAKDGKIYKLVQLASISVIMIAIALVILEAFQLLNVGSTANGIIISIGVIGLGGLTALPWVRVFESIGDRRFKITAIVFLCLIGVCVLLWITCVWQIIGIINDVRAEKGDEALDNLLKSLNVIRISIILSMQFVILSGLVMNVIKYRKELLPYQVMFGVSMLYVDFYLTLWLTAFTVTKDGFEINPTATVLTNQWLLAIFVIALLLTAFPAAIFRRTDRKRLLAAKRDNLKELVSDDPQPQANTYNNPYAQNNAYGDSVEKKLQKLQKLYANGLISQEEYEAKRAEILNDI